MDDQIEENISLGQIEHSFICPTCWREVSILLDLSQSSQDFIEDCESCCNPIRFLVDVDEGEVVSFSAEKPD